MIVHMLKNLEFLGTNGCTTSRVFCEKWCPFIWFYSDCSMTVEVWNPPKLFSVASLFRAHHCNFPKEPIVFVIGARSKEELVEQPGSPTTKAERPNIFDKQGSAVRIQEPSL